MTKYLLDTSVLIEVIRLYNFEAEKFLKDTYQGKIYISQITIAELFSGKSAQDPKVADFLEYLVKELKIVNIKTDDSIIVGKLRYKYSIDIPDAYIEVSAIENNLILVTHDKKHFSKIKGLKIINPKK